jgi:hypothetical protein
LVASNCHLSEPDEKGLSFWDVENGVGTNIARVEFRPDAGGMVPLFELHGTDHVRLAPGEWGGAYFDVDLSTFSTVPNVGDLVAADIVTAARVEPSLTLHKMFALLESMRLFPEGGILTYGWEDDPFDLGRVVS